MSISLKALYDKVNSFEASKSTWTSGSNGNGTWMKESSTGVIIQFGQSANAQRDNNDIYVTFPIKFNSVKSIIKTTVGSYYDTIPGVYTSVWNVTTDGFISRASTVAKMPYYYWMAIGYLITNSIKGWVI